MAIETSLRCTDASGDFLFETRQFLEIGDAPGLHYVLSCGKVGALTVTLPPEFNPLLVKDARIHVMRSVDGRPAQREGESCFLIRKWQFADDYTTVTALHANHILWRRHALWGYYQGRAQTSTGITADNTIKSGDAGPTGSNMWYDNFDAFAESGNRQDGGLSTQADISAFVSVQAPTALAPVVLQRWYWENIGDAAQRMCDASFTAGTYLVAEIVAPTESTLELRTYVDIRGTDRRSSTGNGLIFTSDRGNFANAILTVDAINEVTAAVCGGPGRDSGFQIRGSIDAARMGESPLNRIEVFVDEQEADIAAIQANADAAVRNGRPIITATGDLTDTDTCQRGVHYTFGDLVTVEVRGIQYDMRVDLLDVTLSQGVETTKAGFYYNG